MSVRTPWGALAGHAYLLHVFRKRLIYPDLKTAVLSQAEIRGADEVPIEDRASGTQLLQDLRRDGFGKARPVKHSGDK